jgi:hypothetical protein
MFIGHYGLGLASKRVAPTLSLGTLFLASQWADLLWPVLLLTGVERVSIRPGITTVSPFDFEYYPYSHSLVALIFWGILLGLIYRALTGRSWRSAVVIGALVVSHWFLDVIVHRPDMPLAPGVGLRLGLGLWNSLAGTLIVEFGLFAMGIWLYVKTTVARDRIGSVGLWCLLVFLALVELANLLGPPPPPGASAVAMAGLAMWLLVLWGYWVDRHREPVSRARV